MRTLIVLLLAASVFGCAQAPTSNSYPHNDYIFRPVTDREYADALQRLHLLRADMTDAEVFQTLGLSRFQQEGGGSGGPNSYHWEVYTLRRDPPATVQLIHDFTSPPGTRKLVNVEFGAVRWKALAATNQFIHGF